MHRDLDQVEIGIADDDGRDGRVIPDHTDRRGAGREMLVSIWTAFWPLSVGALAWITDVAHVLRPAGR